MTQCSSEEEAKRESPWPSFAEDLCYKRYIKTRSVPISHWLKTIVSRICSNYPDKFERSSWESRYYQMLAERSFLPTSTTLTNAFYQSGTLAGCMVLPLPTEIDEIIRIFLPQAHAALRNGIGIGFDLSNVGPRLSECMTTGRAYPGPVEILRSIVSGVGTLVEYGGMKRAAFMGSMRVDHPDIFEFLYLKTTDSLPEVNISIAVTQEFKAALSTDSAVPARWGQGQRPLSVEEMAEYENRAKMRGIAPPDLKILDSGAIVSRSADDTVGFVDTGMVFFHSSKILHHIARAVHACGEPGLIDLHTINKTNPTWAEPNLKLSSLQSGCGEIVTTTPCGEQPLLPYEVCHLGSINLLSCMTGLTFDFGRLQYLATIATRFMDDCIDISHSDISQSNEISRLNRKIGLGMMGLADIFALLQLPYGSRESIEFARQVMRVINEAAVQASIDLARERGPFPNWHRSTYCKAGSPPRRNATVTTIAPTGHISILAGCNSGIEPYYLLRYVHDAGGSTVRSAYGAEQLILHVGFTLDEWANASNSNTKWDGTSLSLAANPTSSTSLNNKLNQIRIGLRTAHEVTPDEHLQVISNLQEFVENGISKTVNLQHSTTVREIEVLFAKAMNAAIKGISAFRDGCLTSQMMHTPPKSLSLCESCSL